jgi:hypothetical protein
LVAWVALDFMKETRRTEQAVRSIAVTPSRIG